jgi:D-amino-acid dehydrogenase
MHVVVVGAGIVGTCTAWYLRRHGFEVTVLDRRDGVARETSHGNAGVIAPGYVTPWASPGMPRKVLSYLFAAEAPVVFRPTANPALWRWLRAWLGECELQRYRTNKSRMQRIAFYSRDQLHQLRDELGIEYRRAQGYLQLLRTEREVAMSGPARALLAENAVPHRLLSAEECHALEPALERSTPLAGALFLPEDESGSCPDFATALATHCEAAGVRFAFGRTMRGLQIEGARVTAVQTDTGPLAADAVVIAAAVESVALLAPAGIHLPIWPVKGYSATVALPDPTLGPRRAMIDEAYKVAITPFGDRLRLAGTAEIGSHAMVVRDKAIRTLLKVGRDWFPQAARYETAETWVGARPMTPDGPPLLGATPVRGLFLNVGHGSTGWAMACGSARVVADVVAGREPEIPMEGLTLARLDATTAPS